MNMHNDIQKQEAVGDGFSVELLLAARERSLAAVKSIAEAIHPGMQEAQARELAKQMLLERGMEREWHPTLVRFGGNTLKTFKEASTPAQVLNENDIFFIDIGPVFAGHEGDAGATFVVGNDPDMKACALAAKTLFEEVKQVWQCQHLTGKALYDYAQKTAVNMGWQLNLGSPGHRIGDFPHAIYKADRLASTAIIPSSGLWILEIQIRHPSKAFGAFYEDILLSK